MEALLCGDSSNNEVVLLDGDPPGIEAAMRIPTHTVADVGQQVQSEELNLMRVTCQCMLCPFLTTALSVLRVGLPLWLAE